MLYLARTCSYEAAEKLSGTTMGDQSRESALALAWKRVRGRGGDVLGEGI